MIGMLKDLGKVISGDSASPMGKLTKKDLISFGMGVLDTCISVVLTAFQAQIIPALPPIPAMAANLIITKFLRKWISNGGIPEVEQKN